MPAGQAAGFLEEIFFGTEDSKDHSNETQVLSETRGSQTGEKET